MAPRWTGRAPTISYQTRLYEPDWPYDTQSNEIRRRWPTEKARAHRSRSDTNPPRSVVPAGDSQRSKVRSSRGATTHPEPSAQGEAYLRQRTVRECRHLAQEAALARLTTLTRWTVPTRVRSIAVEGLSQRRGRAAEPLGDAAARGGSGAGLRVGLAMRVSVGLITVPISHQPDSPISASVMSSRRTDFVFSSPPPTWSILDKC